MLFEHAGLIPPAPRGGYAGLQRGTMDVERLAKQARELFPASEPAGHQAVQPLPGMTLYRQPVRTQFEAAIYQPVVCLILQGRKETAFGGKTYRMSAGECLLVSHDLPVLARITVAPYLALLLDVEVETLRSLYDEVGPTTAPTNASALEVQKADEALFDALRRYVALTASPTDAKVLGPMLRRELHYRLLMAPFGGMLRSLLRHDSYASAVARAIAHIRGNFREPIAVPALAKGVGMSTSAFHKHFKAVTSSSPLQYQKDLRLLDARRRLVTGAATVTGAAYEVGYESPTQFSREYARKFGVPPSRDLARAAG